jgi:hypothetical protein
MTFFAQNGQPIPPGTPAWNSAVARQTAKAAYSEQQLRRQEQGYTGTRPPAPTWRELLTPTYSEPQPVIPVSRSRKLRRRARWCMALAVFFTISTWGYAGMHQIGWAVLTGVMTLGCAAAWGRLRDRADEAAGDGG